MKVILNKDLSTLGEEGDVRDVARGYARNYLFPRGIAVPYTPKTVKAFEARKDAIEARKVQKRHDAMGVKEKLESLELSLTMPAGANGRLYGAVTTQTVADELTKQGYEIERKRIELSVASIKAAGKYKVTVKLYENSSAELQLTVIGQAIKTETHHAPPRGPRRRRDEAHAEQAVAPQSGAVAEAVKQEAPAPAAGDAAEAVQQEAPAAPNAAVSEQPQAPESGGV
jgi:large subunit ribosomal protein L9